MTNKDILNFINRHKKKQYNVVICAIAKNENEYINEWVNHHINIGISHIFIYDNNDSTFEDVLTRIDRKDKVTIIRYNDKHIQGMQRKLYEEFYHKYNHKFNWCGFLDIDEFLVGIDNVNKFFNQDKFKKYDQIRIKWKLFGDDDFIDRDRNIPVVEFFKKPILDNFKSDEAKCFIRGCVSNSLWHKTHYVITKEGKLWKCCLPSGRPCNSKDWSIHEDYSNETVFINHYMTKTLKEFIEQKSKRGDVVNSQRVIDLDYYWQINEKTPEKLEWIKNNL